MTETHLDDRRSRANRYEPGGLMRYRIRPPQQCHQIKDDLALMALGLLDGLEQRAVCGHLQHCPSRRRALDALTLVALRLRPLRLPIEPEHLNFLPDSLRH